MEKDVSYFNGKTSSKKQLFFGTIISYILIIFDLIIALFLPKWINSVIGQGNYGVYSLSISLASMFLVDFGLGVASTKFLSKIVVDKNKEQERNILGIIYKLYIIIDIIIFVIYLVLYFVIDKLYVGLSSEQIQLLKILFPVIAVYNLLSFPFVSLEGSFIAHERFVAYKGFGLLQKVLYTLIISLFLFFRLNTFLISIASIISGFIILICKIIYTIFICNFKPNFKYKNKELTKQILSFSVWATVAMVATKLVSSLIPTILGVFSDANNIAVFGYAYALECSAFAFSTVISTMLMPNVTRIMKDSNKSVAEIENLAIKIGKIQIAIILLFLSGFVTFGKQFLIIAMDESYLNAYYCFILLFIPNLLSASFSVCEKSAHILNNVKYISIIQLVASVITLGTSCFFAKPLGAIGVSISYSVIESIGYIVIIVVVFGYFQKMNCVKIFFKIFGPFAMPSIVTTILFIFINHCLQINRLIYLIFAIACFAIVYCVLLYFFSINAYEKLVFKQSVKSFFTKRKTKLKEEFDYIILGNEKKYLDGDKKVEFFETDLKTICSVVVYSKKYGFSTHYSNLINNSFLYYNNLDTINDSFHGIIICDFEQYLLINETFQQAEKIIVLKDSGQNEN